MTKVRDPIAPLGTAAALFLTSTLTLVAAAESDEATPWSLDWSRSDDAAACPSRDQLVADLSKQLGRDPFGDAAGQHVVVQLARDGTRWIAKVRRVDVEGNEQGSQHLTSASSDCSELHRATVAALAVMMGSASAATGGAAAEPPKESINSPSAAESSTASAAEGPPTRSGSASPAPPPSPPSPAKRARSAARRHYLGLQVAVDVVHLSSTQAVCAGNDAYDCYTASGDEFAGVPDPDRGNSVAGGLSTGPGRLLLDYHHLWSDRVGVEARAGFVAFERSRGALPVHLELGTNYWISRPTRRSRAYVGASVGLAAFDTTIRTTVVDCATSAFPEGDPNCSTAGTDVMLDAVRRAGKGFVGATFGAFLHVKGGSGFVLRDAVYVTFPATTVVMEPSLGYAVGW